MKRALWAALCVVGCANGYRGQDTVNVAAPSDQWSETQIRQISEELRILSVAYGVTFQLTEGPAPDVTVHNAVQQTLGDTRGYYTNGTDVVEVYTDSYYTLVPEAFRAVVGHELGHWLGMQHVRETNAMMSESAATDRPTAVDLDEFRRATGREVR